jgi:hypothetical protein
MKNKSIQIFLGVLFVALGSWLLFKQNNRPNDDRPVTIIDDKGLKNKDNLGEFKREIVQGTKGVNWTMTPVPNSELVSKLKGKYFIIDISDADADETIFFSAGKYIIDDFDKKFSRGLLNFGKDVLSKIKNKTEYKIFVKGSADLAGNDSFEGKLVTPYFYSKISFFNSLNSNSTKSKFSTQEVEINIPSIFKNTHLPNLRAKFIQEKFYEIYQDITPIIPMPIILEGNVSLNVDDKDRNATLLLYLPEKFFTQIED